MIDLSNFNGWSKLHSPEMFWNKYTVDSDFETKTDLAWICQERKRVLTVWKPRKSLTQGQQVWKKTFLQSN